MITTPTLRKILVTSALPYANGATHLGHMLEYIQTDIWVRFQKMCNHQCYYVCADDTHGTAIMLQAEKEGLTPEELIKQVHTARLHDFSRFYIGFDNYYTTHSAETQALSCSFYHALKKNKQITQRTIQQLYDPEKEMFLPDRFVKGICPKCQSQDQYGDNCESCGATYSPTELISPYSVVSGATPILKESEHFFFTLSDSTEFLRKYINGAAVVNGVEKPHLQIQARNKMHEWLEGGLSDWDISRDAPYFGFEIPDAPGKYFYVWLDAPIGYIASFKNLADQEGIDFSEFWSKDTQTELYHFIGKDILYFHALFWPALLSHAGYRFPTKINVHGFLTINGQKMSKSRGTFITADSYLRYLPAEALRYYFAAKLNNHIEDIDLNLEDFVNRINADLIGKYINIASRTAGFISQHFANTLATNITYPQAIDLLSQIQDSSISIAQGYEDLEFSRVVRKIMALADQVNQFFNENQPWKLVHDKSQYTLLHEICSTLLNAFRLLTVYLKPILPQLAKAVENLLNIAPLQWQDSNSLLYTHTIKPYQHLMTRIEQKAVQAMLKESSSTIAPSVSSIEPIAETVCIEDFTKLDLRVAKVIAAQLVPGSKKMLQLTLDIGMGTRNVFAGIQATYAPADLIGRYVIMIANLMPRIMQFGTSEGMVLAASNDPNKIFILSPDTGATCGMRVK